MDGLLGSIMVYFLAQRTPHRRCHIDSLVWVLMQLQLQSPIVLWLLVLFCSWFSSEAVCCCVLPPATAK
jgi:hypothetical protein